MKKNTNYDPIRKRYNRLAFIYNFLETPLEYFRFASWRKKLGDRIVGPRALAVAFPAVAEEAHHVDSGDTSTAQMDMEKIDSSMIKMKEMRGK